MDMSIESEDGACDLAWPVEEIDPTDFAISVTDALASKGYCTVQMCMGGDEQEEALTAAARLQEPLELFEEFEVDYLGRNNTTKAMQLGHDLPDKVLNNALLVCDRQLTQLGLMLNPLTEPLLGFTASGRTRGLVRSRYANSSEAATMKAPPLIEDDIDEGHVENHLAFLQSRRLCMFYMINNEGGELKLFPNAGEVIRLPVEKNKLLVFSHEMMMSFEYKPVGKGLALQSWMNGPVQSFELDRLLADPEARLELLKDQGPCRPESMRAQIMCMSARIPGNATSGAAWMSTVAAGTDTVTRWPQQRYDEGLYYSPDPNDTIFGKSYTNHVGALTNEEVTNLDNEFFDVSETEAQSMSMNQRMWLEVGYVALNKAGFTRSSVSGQSVGCFLGDVGSDWHGFTSTVAMYHYHTDYTAAAVHSGVCCSRISHIFNLLGPTMTFDTACSASLYATHHAHMAMINMYEHNERCDGSLVGGVNSTGPTGHISNCMGNILSHVGRCHTYDERADGYQRGEGSAGIYIKLNRTTRDLDDRLATIMGTCSSQDGKSASLTAPSGPAQQAMLRHSFRMAGIESTEIGFTETHGTGTSLGDPIEMGAIVAVFEEERNPLFHSTPKTNVGHLESSAGISGLTKCLLGLFYQVATPNIHFHKLNPHMEMEGFPRSFQNEITPLSSNACYAGVSSFGFAGADARCEFYGRALDRPFYNTEYNMEKLEFISVPCPRCLGAMCWKCLVAIPSHAPKGRHRCSLVRAEGGTYDFCSNCYVGGYRFGDVISDQVDWHSHDSISIIGTWNKWSEPLQMDQIEDGSYRCAVALGDTCSEQFQLIVNDNYDDAIYPAASGAGMSLRIVGPDGGGKDKYWLLDGRGDMEPSGTTYIITFEWADPKKITWEVATDAVPESMPAVYSDLHEYGVVGSWLNNGSLSLMEADEKIAGIYRYCWTMESWAEKLQIVVDDDRSKVMHPNAEDAVPGSPESLLIGPDSEGRSFSWLISGEIGMNIEFMLDMNQQDRRKMVSWLQTYPMELENWAP